MGPPEQDSNKKKKSSASKLDEREDFVAGDMSSPLPSGYFFRSHHSISYFEYQPFLVKVKGMANRVAGAKGHEPCGPRDKFSKFFRSRYSISYVEYQPLLVKLR